MKPWTTLPQSAWLTERIPQWYRRKDKANKGFLSTTTAKFFETFPDSKYHPPKLQTKIRQWFYFHSRKRSPPPPTAPSVLAVKPPRKVVPLTQGQAYSLLFCKKGSPLHYELREAWKLYTAADKATLEKYHHLFPALHNPRLPFVAFQQVVLKHRVAHATKEELSAVEEFISTRLQEKKDTEERPWSILKVDESQSEVDLERQYIADQIASLSAILEGVCEEVRNATNFKPFILFGGPSPKGTGGIQVFHVGTGETISEGQAFPEYLGDFWYSLKDKYCEWLNAGYTHDELLRSKGSVNGPSKTTTSTSAAASTPQQSPDLETAPRGTMKTARAAGNEAPAVTTMTPAQTMDDSTDEDSTTASTDDDSTEASTDDDSTEASTDDDSTEASTDEDTAEASTDEDAAEASTDEDVAEASTDEDAAAASTKDDATEDDSSMSSSSPSRSPSPTQTTPDQLEVSSSPARRVQPARPPARRVSSVRPPARRPLPARPPALQTQTCPPALQKQAWPPTHTPSWSLGPQHNAYVHHAVPYLIGVPGGPGWEKLLASFVTFESLSSSRSALSKLPVRPRPRELGLWFKMGRPLQGSKAIPSIESVQDFENEWVAWWSAIQPPWRDTKDWPLVREDVVRQQDWGDLPNGGKDGLFLVVVSLGWWIHARGATKGSKVDDAIADVTWVIDNLVSLLSANATTPDSDSDPGSALDSRMPGSSTQPRKRAKPVKVGVPSKRTKRTRS